LEESAHSADIHDVLLLYQQYVDMFIFVWTYVRRREHEKVDHEISAGASLHPGTKVKHGAGAELP
jgi:hypothetical protein